MANRGAFLGRIQLAPAFRLGSLQVMTDADEGLIEASRAVVVKFFANGCPPCGEYKPVYSEVANREPQGIMMVEVDVDLAPGLYSKYDIQATPTTIFLSSGKELNRVEGKMTTEGLEAMIKSAFGTGASPSLGAAGMPSSGPSKTLLVAGGIGVMGLVTGALLLAKG